ncbi:MAG TPA: hypothetical protein VFV52_12640 [Bacilli bacterium]|nr:hypothetical protein [Bacilli bacterium]
MRQRKTFGSWLVLFVMLLCLIPSVAPRQLIPQVEAAPNVTATYKAPDGLLITSYSPAWAEEDKLKALYNELLQNVHGKEIDLLGEVVIYDDYPHGKTVAGQYFFQTLTVFFPSKPQMQPGKIELYGGKEHNTVGSFAHTLAHEYGHHVTHYYTLQTDGYSLVDENRWRKTTYAAMRGLAEDNRVCVSGCDHRWMIAEIAAEDYVQLFGSPLSKAQTAFPSRIEQAMAGVEPGPVSWNGSMYNVQPQENHLLPMASEVPGLYDFFYSKMKGKSGNYHPPAKPNLKLESYSDVAGAGYQLHFSWDIAGRTDDAYSYTLVTYKDDEQLGEPIVTRKPGEKHEVSYGSVLVRKGAFLYTFEEPGGEEGKRHFKLYAFDKNGWVSDSHELTVDMADPSEVTVSDSKVIPVAHTPEPEGDSMGLDWLYHMDIKVDLSWLERIVDFFDMMIEGVSSVVDFFLGE